MLRVLWGVHLRASGRSRGQNCCKRGAVSVCLYLHLCLYPYLYLYLCVYIYMCIYMYIYIYMHALPDMLFVCSFTYTFVHKCVDAALMCMCASICVYVYTNLV